MKMRIALTALFLSACAVSPASQRDMDAALAVPQHIESAAPFSRTDHIYFSADSTVIGAEARAVLQSVATIMRMNRVLAIDLIGYADRLDTAPLAMRRAIALRNALSQMGVVSDRITIHDPEKSGTNSVDIIMRATPADQPA